MFPSNELPKIIADDTVVPVQSDNEKQTHKKRKFIIPTSNEQLMTLVCILFIVFIIASAVLIGLVSVFLPRPTDNSSTIETITVTYLFPITSQTSNDLFSNNNSLIANYYLNNNQKNIFKACLQLRLSEDDRTKQMTILSIGNAHILSANDTKTNSTSRRKRRRQILPRIDQVEITLTMQCYPSISKMECRQDIESVLNTKQSLTCTTADETMIATSSSSSTEMKDEQVAHIQHWRQVGQLFLAFGLTSLVGLERQLRGKNAGLRTHSIVGTTSALILQVSKYGFSDVIHEGMVVLDPSRIAAQIISGISFLGAGLIITRQRAIRGLTTAASVWSAAAIGMAAGCGLWVLSLAVTGLHFIILLGFLPLEKRLPVFDKNSPFYLKTDPRKDNEGSNDESDEDAQSL
ncbi:unnamed protein product [Adineta ricciae]|uniref:MgtC/SapB/SrpB/YhiD N-terminal domain-containing protein n=1 Tax=Adineta ricciae TaxID=249248 RepID=A0A814Q082_ADIRI|nr:unnamed protein product [Adineta ricciae]CAF1189893.1 unnamed protein product [Adineta ricciae]